jgi:hypothetical protein
MASAEIQPENACPSITVASPALIPSRGQIDLPPNILDQYVALKVLPDGRICGVHRLLYHWTLQVDVHEEGYEDRYCYFTKELAVEALDAWNGQGDPVGWHRHPKTHRRRDVLTGEEWIAP